MWPVVATINDLEPATKLLSDEELRAKTAEFKARVAARVSEATQGIEDKEELEKRRRRPSGRRWTRFCRRPLRWCARLAGARCRCGTLTCS
jgi:hypothetical protein